MEYEEKERKWDRQTFFDFAQTKFDSQKRCDVICWQGLFFTSQSYKIKTTWFCVTSFKVK